MLLTALVGTAVAISLFVAVILDSRTPGKSMPIRTALATVFALTLCAFAAEAQEHSTVTEIVPVGQSAK